MSLRRSQVETLKVIHRRPALASAAGLAAYFGISTASAYDRIKALRRREHITVAFIAGPSNTTVFYRLTASGQRALTEKGSRDG